ncbi:MAG: GNAT family N-acetyltransferase [Pseudomonadota bacterium]
MDIVSLDLQRDLELYLEGEVEAFQHSFPGVSLSHVQRAEMKASVVELAGNQDFAAFTALSENRPVGFVVVSMQWFYTSPQGYIDSIYVMAEHRAQGIGGQLLNAAEHWAAQRGARSVRLDVSVVNTTAIGMYESAGFGVTRVQMERPIAR